MKTRTPLVLIVDSHQPSRNTIEAILLSHAIAVEAAAEPDAALAALNRLQPDCIIIDQASTGWSGPDLVAHLRQRLPDTPIIAVTDTRDPGVVVEAMRQGIFDCLQKPVNANSLVLSLGRALEDRRLKEEVRLLKGKLQERVSLKARMGDSDRVQALVRLLEKIAPTPFTVLIEGESGAGKELVARAIHDMSRVNAGQFVAVDCGAIPESLFESELFGHVKGAFTGASEARIGFFEAADNGTLFLDEVCNLSYTAQQKLLRVIEERTVVKIGATVPRKVNVRIIAASNRPLEKDVENRLFRVDLLHRLKEVSVKVPPLRDRREDIGFLAGRFLEEFRAHLGIRNPGLSPEAVRVLMEYPWPGNVRELKNVMRQAALTCDEDSVILPRHLSFLAHATAAVATPPAPPGAEPSDLLAARPDASLADLVGEFSRALEKSLIEQAIRQAGGNKAAAAKRLRIDYKTLHRKRRLLGIE